MKLWQIQRVHFSEKHYKSSLFASSHRRRWPRHLLFVNKSKSKHAIQSIARLPSTLTAEDFFSKLCYNKSNLPWKCSRSLQFSFFLTALHLVSPTERRRKSWNHPSTLRCRRQEARWCQSTELCLYHHRLLRHEAAYRNTGNNTIS